METFRIYIYQEHSVSYSGRFTWGEGYQEEAYHEYGPASIYIEEPSLPTRLVADLKEIKKQIANKNSGFCDEDGDCHKSFRILQELTNKEKVLIVHTHNEDDVNGFLEIDSINIPVAAKSIFAYIQPNGIYDPSVNANTVSYALNCINQYDENQILDLLGLRFGESYLACIDSKQALKLFKIIMAYALEKVLKHQGEAIISEAKTFDFKTIRHGLYAAISIPSKGCMYLSEDDISKCINLSIRYCADLFLEKTAYKILNGTDSDDYQEALDSLNSCRHISEKVDLYINKVTEGILLKRKQFILNCENDWNYETIYTSLKSCLPQKYQDEDRIKRQTIFCAKELFNNRLQQLLRPDSHCDYQAEYKHLRDLFPDVIERTLTCELNAHIQKFVPDLLNKKAKELIENQENIDYQAAYNSLIACIPNENYSFSIVLSETSNQGNKSLCLRYIQVCCEIFMAKKIEDILKSNLYLHHNAVLDALKPCLPVLDNITELTFLLNKYSTIYISRWLVRNNYIKNFEDNIIGRENFSSEQEYKEFAVKYLENTPENFDDIIIDTIIERIFTDFKMPARYRKIEVEKLAGPKIIGKIDLDKIRKK